MGISDLLLSNSKICPRLASVFERNKASGEDAGLKTREIQDGGRDRYGEEISKTASSSHGSNNDTTSVPKVDLY